MMVATERQDAVAATNANDESTLGEDHANRPSVRSGR
jgi:hypothetical protein